MLALKYQSVARLESRHTLFASAPQRRTLAMILKPPIQQQGRKF